MRRSKWKKLNLCQTSIVQLGQIFRTSDLIGQSGRWVDDFAAVAAGFTGVLVVATTSMALKLR